VFGQGQTANKNRKAIRLEWLDHGKAPY